MRSQYPLCKSTEAFSLTESKRYLWMTSNVNDKIIQKKIILWRTLRQSLGELNFTVGHFHYSLDVLIDKSDLNWIMQSFS